MISERELQENLLKLLQESGEYKLVLKEVPYKYKRIDVVLVDWNNKIISIELKIKNWQKVLDQASVNLVFSDHSYIGIPYTQNQKVISRLLKKVENLSLGLMLIEKNKYKIIKKAPENNYLIERYYSLFKKSIYSNLSVPNL